MDNFRELNTIKLFSDGTLTVRPTKKSTLCACIKFAFTLIKIRVSDCNFEKFTKAIILDNHSILNQMQNLGCTFACSHHKISDHDCACNLLPVTIHGVPYLVLHMNNNPISIIFLGHICDSDLVDINIR